MNKTDIIICTMFTVVIALIGSVFMAQLFTINEISRINAGQIEDCYGIECDFGFFGTKCYTEPLPEPDNYIIPTDNITIG